MNLIIDLGNTRIKLAVVNDHGQILQVERRLKRYTLSIVSQMTKKFIIKNAILSSTSHPDDQLLKILVRIPNFIILDENSTIPIQIAYTTPSTLGKDRLAAVVGAFKQFPNENTLIIDMGTCMTMDLITNEGVFIGGNISPGIQMRLKAMHRFTAKLPLVKAFNTHQLFGTSSETALQNGAVRGALYEIEGVIQAVKVKYKKINVILTGGDAIFYENWSKIEIFAAPDLVIEGLNEILKYNVKQN